MDDKNEIIIDGVNVAECEFFNAFIPCYYNFTGCIKMETCICKSPEIKSKLDLPKCYDIDHFMCEYKKRKRSEIEKKIKFML